MSDYHKNLAHFLNPHGFHLINNFPTHNTHKNHTKTSRIKNQILINKKRSKTISLSLY